MGTLRSKTCINWADQAQLNVCKKLTLRAEIDRWLRARSGVNRRALTMSRGGIRDRTLGRVRDIGLRAVSAGRGGRMDAGGLAALLVHEGLLKQGLGDLSTVLHLIGSDMAAGGSAAVTTSAGGGVSSHDLTSDTATMGCLANRR